MAEEKIDERERTPNMPKHIKEVGIVDKDQAPVTFEASEGRIFRAKFGRELKEGEKFIIAEQSTMWRDTFFRRGERAIIRKDDKVPPNFK